MTPVNLTSLSLLLARVSADSYAPMLRQRPLRLFQSHDGNDVTGASALPGALVQGERPQRGHPRSWDRAGACDHQAHVPPTGRIGGAVEHARRRHDGRRVRPEPDVGLSRQPGPALPSRPLGATRNSPTPLKTAVPARSQADVPPPHREGQPAWFVRNQPGVGVIWTAHT